MAEFEFSSGLPSLPPQEIPTDGPIWVVIGVWDKEFRYARPDRPHELGTGVKVVNRLTGEERQVAFIQSVNHTELGIDVDRAKSLNRTAIDAWVERLNVETE